MVETTPTDEIIEVTSVNEFAVDIGETKEGFGVLEPIDPIELRPIPLSKIRDLNEYERDIITTAIHATSPTSAAQALVAGDIVVQLDGETLQLSYETASTGLDIWKAAATERPCIKVDVGSGMVVDSVAVKLKDTGTPSGTMKCYIYTGFDAADSTVGTLVETSSTELAMTTLTGTYKEYTFLFDDQTLYEDEIFIVFGNLSVSASNHPILYVDTSSDNNDRLTTRRNNSTSGVRTQADDAWVRIRGQYDSGIYKAHSDRPARTNNTMEVLDTAAVAGDVELNLTGVFYKQSGLTAGKNYLLTHNGGLSLTTGEPIGNSITTTILNTQTSSGVNMEIVAGTTYTAINDTGIPLGNSVTATTYEEMLNYSVGASGTYQLDYDLALQATSAGDVGYCSIRVDGVEKFVDTLTDPTTSGSFTHNIYLPAGSELSAYGKIEDNAGAGADLVKINGKFQVRYEIQPINAILINIT